MDNALYPILLSGSMDYMKYYFSLLNHVVEIISSPFGLVISFTYLNCRGLHILGFSVVLLTSLALFWFPVLEFLSILGIKLNNDLLWISRWWNGGDTSISCLKEAITLAGEVEDPDRMVPKSLFIAIILVVSLYLFSLLAANEFWIQILVSWLMILPKLECWLWRNCGSRLLLQGPIWGYLKLKRAVVPSSFSYWVKWKCFLLYLVQCLTDFPSLHFILPLMIKHL